MAGPTRPHPRPARHMLVKVRIAPCRQRAGHFRRPPESSYELKNHNTRLNETDVRWEEAYPVPGPLPGAGSLDPALCVAVARLALPTGASAESSGYFACEATVRRPT